MENSIYSTKYQLAAALKNRLKTTPLDKITIKELAADCGVNRQTFYYHFDDIYDLMQWCLDYEATTILGIDREDFDWKECVRRLVGYIDENHALCMSVLSSMGHRMLRNIISYDIELMIRKVVDPIYSKNSEMDERESDFYIQFYALAVGGLIESWILDEISIPTEELIGYIQKILSDNNRRLSYE